MEDKMRITRNLWKDRKAGIEGLPLQLMIMVIIAGVGSTIIMGWMANLSAPTSISEMYSSPSEIVLNDKDNDGVYSKSNFGLTITVLDQNGDGVQGAVIVLQGASLSSSDGNNVHGVTDSNGQATFSGLSASNYGTGLEFITVTAAKNEYGADSRLIIPVISE